MGLGSATKDVQRGIVDVEIRMEYYDAGDLKASLRYEGINSQGAPTGSATWVIRRFEWGPPPVGLDYILTRVQVLKGSWDGRAALPWA